MSMRRRRKQLTNVLYTMDRKIRATSLRQVKRVTATGSDAAEEAETTTPANTPPPVGTEISVVAPDQWVKIVGGYYYPPNKTGGLGQVELFLDENPQLSVGDSMFVSGIQVKWSVVSGTPPKTYAGSFYPHTGYENSESIRIVSKFGSPAWSGRATSTKPTYRAVTPGVTNTIIYTITNKTEIPNSVAISFRGRVASYFASTTTATLTFTAAHYFRVSQIIDVSSLGAPMADVDGIVKITSVPSSTQISYEFVKPRSASIPSTVVTDEKYAYGVVSKYTPIGSSWIDPTTKKVFIWDGLRWSGYTDALEEGLVTNDGLPPAAPTSLSLTSVGYAEDGVLGKVAKSSVALSWTGPTTNSTGGPLNDLAGYRIWYSTTSATGPWIAKQNFGLETEQTLIGLIPDLTYYFKVIAFDTYGLDSTGLDGNIVAQKAALSVETPSAPILTSKLGTVTVKWDGKDYTNSVIPTSILSRVDIHASTSSGFTPSSTTLVGKLTGGSDFSVITDLTYNTDYYFRLVAVDINGRSTNGSTQATIKIKPLVDADLIAAKLNAPLSSWPFAPKAVTAGALADGALDASTVFGPDVVTQDAIAANAIGADQIAANAITAGKINAGAVTAAKIDALAITADKLAANAVTADKINAGAITSVKIEAGAVTAGKIEAGSITGDRVNATTAITFSSGLSSATIGTGAIAGQGGYATGLSVTAGGTTGDFGTYNDGNGVQVLNRGASAGLFIYNGGASLDFTGVSGSIGITNTGTGNVFLQAQDGAAQINGNSAVWLSSAAFFGLSYNNTIEYAVMRGYPTSNASKVILANGNASTTNQTLDVYGRIRASGSITANATISSIRYKTDIREFQVPEALFSISPKIFKYDNEKKFASWKDKSSNMEKYSEDTIGAIAEEFIEAGLGYLVDYDEEGLPESLDYSRVAVLLIPTIKKLKDDIDSLKNQIGTE